MKKAAIGALLVLAACGGSSGEFDEDAVHDEWQRREPSAGQERIHELVDITRDACEGDDDEFRWTVLLKLDQGTDPLTDPFLSIGCPDRTQQMLDELDG